MWSALLLAIALSSGARDVSAPLGSEPWVWQPEPGSIELFVGGIKMGKSHAARVRTRCVRRMLAWDPQRDEPELGHGRVTVGQLEQLEHRLGAGVVRLAVRPTGWSDAEVIAEFDRFCRCAWRVGGLCVKVDEAGGVVDPRMWGGAFNKVIREGRHRSLSLVIVGQRFPMSPVLARDNAERLVVFHHGFDDAPEVAKRLSGRGVMVTPEQVAELARHQYIEWTPHEGARMRPPLRGERST